MCVCVHTACDAGNLGSIPELGRFPGGGNGNPLQYSCLRNPMDRRAWRATVHRAARVWHDLATKPPPPSLLVYRKLKALQNDPSHYLKHHLKLKTVNWIKRPKSFKLSLIQGSYWGLVWRASSQVALRNYSEEGKGQDIQEFSMEKF